MELPGKLKIGVSGCINQCAETCIKDVALVGKPAGWTVMVGGSGGVHPRLSQTLAEGLSDDEALALVDKVIAYFAANARRGQRLGGMIDKMGMDAFKAEVMTD